MKIRLPGLFLTLLCVMASTASGALPLEGRWLTPEGEGTVEIRVVNGVLEGELVASTNKQAKLGTLILRDFVRSGDGWKGRLYAPKHDRTLNAELALRDGKLVIKVSAGIRSQSVIWTRAK